MNTDEFKHLYTCTALTLRSCVYVHIYKASGFVALAHTALARTYRAAAPLQLCVMHVGDHRHSPGVGAHKQ